MRNPELEARCLETTAAEDYAVYGDWLEQHGDPRGKLIALQLAGLDPGDLLGELGPPPQVDVTWRNGFWHTIVVRGYGVDLAALLDHESAALVRELTLDPQPVADFDVAILERGRAIDNESWTALLRIVLRHGHGAGTAWLSALPALERLQLGPRALVVDDTVLDEPWGRTIACVRGLSKLRLDSPIARSSTSREALLALGPLADSLVTLDVRSCDDLDLEVIAMLETFPRLAVLRMSNCSSVDDTCGQVIGTFAAIETVDIRGTAITAQGVKRLARSRTIQKIVLDDEQYPDDIEHVLGIELADF